MPILSVGRVATVRRCDGRPKKGDVPGIKEFVTAHEREYKYEYESWGGRVSIEHNHDSCEECCHEDARQASFSGIAWIG